MTSPLPRVPSGKSVSIIAAVAQNGVIGRHGKLPWGQPLAHDMRRFREYTEGKDVVVGRRTFASIGHPLAGRHTIIVSKRMLAHEGCTMAPSFKEALLKANRSSEIFVIGGARLYKEALTVASRIFLTIVLRDYEGDVLFPKWNKKRWRKTCEFDMRDSGVMTRFEAWDLRAPAVQ